MIKEGNIMKLGTKKIVLIMAVGILAFSGAFGDDLANFKNVYFENHVKKPASIFKNVKDYSAKLSLKNESGEVIMAERGEGYQQKLRTAEISPNAKLKFNITLKDIKTARETSTGEKNVTLSNGEAIVEDVFQGIEPLDEQRINVKFKPDSDLNETLSVIVELHP